MKPRLRPHLLFVLLLLSCSDTVSDSGPEDGAVTDLATDESGDRSVDQDALSSDVALDSSSGDQADRDVEGDPDLTVDRSDVPSDQGLDRDADGPVEGCPLPNLRPPVGPGCTPSCPPSGQYQASVGGTEWILDVGTVASSLKVGGSFWCGDRQHALPEQLLSVTEPEPDLWRIDTSGVAADLRNTEDCAVLSGRLELRFDDGLGGVCEITGQLSLSRDLGPPVLEMADYVRLAEGEIVRVPIRAEDPDCRVDARLLAVDMPSWAQLEPRGPMLWDWVLRPPWGGAGEYVVYVTAFGSGASDPADASNVIEVTIQVDEAREAACLMDSDCIPCGICRTGVCRTRFECALDVECPYDSTCFDGECEPTCTGDQVCPANRVCVDSVCQLAPACNNSFDCGEGMACRENSCGEVACDDDDECVGAELCSSGTCQMVSCASCGDGVCTVAVREGRDVCTRVCSEDYECPDHLNLCNDGACVERITCGTIVVPASCSVEENCPTGVRCVDNRCVLPEVGCPDPPYCTADFEEECRFDADCPLGTTCWGIVGQRLCMPVPIAVVHRCEDGCPAGSFCWEDGACYCLEDECGGSLDMCLENPISGYRAFCSLEASSMVCPRGSQCVEDLCRPPMNQIPRGARCHDECPAGEVCDPVTQACSILGGLSDVCRALPAECTDSVDPVCGCDGITYDNDCLRLQAGASLHCDTPCEEAEAVCGCPADTYEATGLPEFEPGYDEDPPVMTAPEGDEDQFQIGVLGPSVVSVQIDVIGGQIEVELHGADHEGSPLLDSATIEDGAATLEGLGLPERTLTVVVRGVSGCPRYTLTPSWVPTELCDNEDDDNGDDLRDCNDPICAVQPICAVCPGVDLGSQVGADLAIVTNFTHGDDSDGSCGAPDGEDRALEWTSPADDTYVFQARGRRDWAVYLQDSCGGDQLADACGTGRTVFIDQFVAEGDSVTLVVDGDGDTSGWSWVSVGLSEGGRCEDEEDNDFDGYSDCSDRACFGDSACALDGCPNEDLGDAIGTRLAEGTIDGESNDLSGSCGGAGPDVAFSWTAPEGRTWRFDARQSTFSGVIYLLRTSCKGDEITCRSDEMVRDVVLRAGERVIIVLDAVSEGATGTYRLDIGGGGPRE